MNPDALKAFLRIGVFIGGCGLVMIFLQPPGSGEFVVSVCSALIGLTMILMVVLLLRFDPTRWIKTKHTLYEDTPEPNPTQSISTDDVSNEASNENTVP